ncbi:MAG: hypothetical protein AMJ78_10515, partial [Omnitrophica WOR_2 bacterium SM23_29]
MQYNTILMTKSILLITAICLMVITTVEAATDEDLYRRGQSYLQKGNYDEAIKAYKKFIDKYPNSKLLPYALYDQGWCYLEKKGFSSARIAFKKLVKDFPNIALAADAQLAIGE